MHSFGLLVWRGQLFHLVWVGSLEGAAVFIWFGLLVWRGRLFHLVLGCLCGGAAGSIYFCLVVLVSLNCRWWFGRRGPLFHLLVWRGRF